MVEFAFITCILDIDGGFDRKCENIINKEEECVVIKHSALTTKKCSVYIQNLKRNYNCRIV